MPNLRELLLLGLSPMLAVAQSPGVTITRFVVGGAGAITTGPDGALWFTRGNYNQIGRITSSGTITTFPIPTASSTPVSITAGPDGALWFAEYRGNRIGRITVAGSVTEFALPAAASSPNAITSGPDGSLWFVESDGNNIGRISTQGSITEFAIPTTYSQPAGIATGPDGALWFTEYGSGSPKIGRITTGGKITEYPVPYYSSGGPDGITQGSDGNLWFIGIKSSFAGRITPAGALTQFPFAGAGGPYIVSGPDGAVWFNESSASAIGRLTTSGAFTQFPLPSAFQGGSDQMTLGPDGALWFTSGTGDIGRLALNPVLSAVVSAASGAANVAPGEIVALYGTGLGLYQLNTLTLQDGVIVPAQLAGTTVTFNGIPAPLIYTSYGQVAVVVPYEITGTSAQVAVNFESAPSATFTVTVSPSAPGIFTADSSGKGQAAALNGDGSVNSPAHPVPANGIVVLFATGEGQTAPAGTDGKLATAPYPAPILPVSAMIGGIPATVLYAGAAPGEVAGLMQVNLQVPPGIGTGSAVAVSLTVGSVTSPSGVTVAIGN